MLFFVCVCILFLLFCVCLFAGLLFVLFRFVCLFVCGLSCFVFVFLFVLFVLSVVCLCVFEKKPTIPCGRLPSPCARRSLRTLPQRRCQQRGPCRTRCRRSHGLRSRPSRLRSSSARRQWSHPFWAMFCFSSVCFCVFSCFVVAVFSCVCYCFFFTHKKNTQQTHINKHITKTKHKKQTWPML